MTLSVLRSGRLPAIILLAALVCVAAPRAQEVTLTPLLALMQAYLSDTYPRLANIVVNEEYAQQLSLVTRRLSSELLLVHHPVEQRNWLVFRDVLSVDGRPVSDHDQRLTQLFIAPTAETMALVSEINNASMQYQIRAPHVALTNPYVVVGLMDRFYAPKLDFSLTKADRKDPGTRVIEFSERPVARAGKDADARQQIFGTVRADGTVAIDTTTGRIVKTRLSIDSYGKTTTTFRQDDTLNVIVPVEMETQWGPAGVLTVKGKAKYTRVRQFGIVTDETMKGPIGERERSPK